MRRLIWSPGRLDVQFVLRIKNNVFEPKNDVCLNKNGLKKLFLIASPYCSGSSIFRLRATYASETAGV